jgi:hypothetical protein
MLRNLTNINGPLPAGTPPALRLLVEGKLTVAQFRAMRPLPENAQKLIDDSVIRVGLDRLQVTADILQAGLTYDIGQSFWGVTQLQWDMQSEAGGAKRTMEPRARGENFIVDRTPTTIPVYLTWDTFELGIRTLAASQRGGGLPLDTTLIEQATRRVNEAIEDATINGIPTPVFGSTVYGLLNAPNANTYAYAGGTAWDNVAKTGQQILNDVLAMVALAVADKHYGPYNLYIPTAYDIALNKNWSDGVTTFPITVRQRLEQMMFGGRALQVKVADQLPANRTVLVQMTKDVLDIVTGQEPTVISWDQDGGLGMNWIVLACMIPRVKTTYTSQSGIVVGNTV